MAPSLSAEERETTVTSTDADPLVRIWSNQRRHISRLRNHESYTEVRSGYDGTTEWAEFTIHTTLWNPATGAKRKRKPLTEEQRAVVADRLARARNRKETGQ